MAVPLFAQAFVAQASAVLASAFVVQAFAALASVLPSSGTVFTPT